MPSGVTNNELRGAGGGRDNLFLWTVFLLLLAGVGFACWLGSFYIFGHPEQPRAYKILTRLGKVAAPVRFLVTKAPPGEFLGAQRAFEQYSKFTTLQLEHENELLFRNYIKNYAETKRLVPYLTGKYSILKVYELQPADLVASGVVALAQSDDFPQLLVELIYPTDSRNVPDLMQLLQPGLEVHLEKTLDLSAILHVGHALDGRLQVTTMPLLYGNYALKNGVGTFSLEPPYSLNVGAGFPMVRGEEVRSVMREQLEIKRKRLVAKLPQGQESTPGAQLVRVDRDPNAPAKADAAIPAEAVSSGSATSTVAANPTAPATVAKSSEVPAKTASVVASGTTTASAVSAQPNGKSGKQTTLAQGTQTPAAASATQNPQPPPVPPPTVKAGAKVDGTMPKTDALVVKAEPVKPTNGSALPPKTDSVPAASKTPAKPATPPAPTVAAATPLPPPQTTQQPPAVSPKAAPTPSPVPLAVPVEPKPFVAAAPTAAPTGPTGSWKTYSSGQQPGGRVVSTEQATALAGRNDSGRVYLRGQFVVTATGNNRAVLRLAKTDDRTPPARVIVEYPAGAVPPSQGSAIARDDGRGFEIREVRKSPDGQVNIFVREVNTP
ncbi:MAG: hypothetical protein WCO60_01585 [Verrucomicrobiota bacterium]